MRILLDTHVLLWALAGDDRLAPRSVDLVADGRNIVCVSAASVWEIAIKRSLGKLRAPDDTIAAIDAASFRRLPIGFEHADAVAKLPNLHRDPFDRLLVAQASVEGLALMTHDPMVQQYDVDVLAV